MGQRKKEKKKGKKNKNSRILIFTFAKDLPWRFWGYFFFFFFCMRQGFILKFFFEILPCLPGLAKKWSKYFFCLRRKCLFAFFPPKNFFYFWLVRSPNKRCHISYSPPPSKDFFKNRLVFGKNHEILCGSAPESQMCVASVHFHNVRCISLRLHIAHKLFVRCALVLSDAVQQRRRLLKVLFDDVLEDLVPQCVRVV